MDNYLQYCDQGFNNSPNEDIEKSPNTNINENHNMILEPPNEPYHPNLTVQNPHINLPPLQSESKNKQDNNNQNNIQGEQTFVQNNNNNFNNNINNNVINPDEYFKEDNDPDKLNFYPELPQISVNRPYLCYQYNENPPSEFLESESNDNHFIHRTLAEVTMDETKDMK